MCFTDKRKKNWIRKEDRVPDPVRPPGRVGSGQVRVFEPSQNPSLASPELRFLLAKILKDGNSVYIPP